MSYKPDEDPNSETEDENKSVSNENNTTSYENIEDTAEDSPVEFEKPYRPVISNKPIKPEKSNVKGMIYDLIFYALLIFVCVYILPNFVLQRTIVDGASMENTLQDNDQLYVEKLSYRFDALNRFDIIVFYPYGRENEEYYVKRIIGLPGETVQIIGSDIYIDGEILKENYGKDPIDDPGRAEQLITLGKDEYFVLGDNREISKDSRSEEVGNVKRENIGGRVILRILPLNKFGLVD